MSCIATFNNAEIVKSDCNLFAEIKRYIIKKNELNIFLKEKHQIFLNRSKF